MVTVLDEKSAEKLYQVLSQSLSDKLFKSRGRVTCSACRKGNCSEHKSSYCSVCRMTIGRHDHDPYLPVDVIRQLLRSVDLFWKEELVSLDGHVEHCVYRPSWEPNTNLQFGVVYGARVRITFCGEEFYYDVTAQVFDNADSRSTLIKRLLSAGVKGFAKHIGLGEPSVGFAYTHIPYSSKAETTHTLPSNTAVQPQATQPQATRSQIAQPQAQARATQQQAQAQNRQAATQGNVVAIQTAGNSAPTKSSTKSQLPTQSGIVSPINSRIPSPVVSPTANSSTQQAGSSRYTKPVPAVVQGPQSVGGIRPNTSAVRSSDPQTPTGATGGIPARTGGNSNSDSNTDDIDSVLNDLSQ